MNNESILIENKPKKHTFRIVLLAIIIFALIGDVIYLNIRMMDNKLKENIEIKYTNPTFTNTDEIVITDVSLVVNEVMPSIVSITSKTVINSGRYGFSFFRSGSYTTQGAGSGIIVSSNENEIFILTNYHVVQDTTELSVKFIDDKSYDATIKGVSKNKDIAIVSVKKSDISKETLESIKIAVLGDSDNLKVGNGIIAIGNALGYGQSVTTGVVSALNREVTTDSYTQDMIQIDAAINGGNSGGALLNSKGEVVGINTAKYSSSILNSSASVEGMGFAIPISDIKPIIDSLISGKDDTEELTLGIEGAMTSEMYNYNLPDGFYITSIKEGSNADNSELEIGNIITEIDGNKVTSINTIKKVLNNKKIGDKILLKIRYVSRNEYKEKEIFINLNN